MEVKKFGSNKEEDVAPFLEKLCRFALEKGAAAAGVISVDNIEFLEEDEERALKKESSYWPTVEFNKDPISRTLKEFKHAMVFKLSNSNSSSENNRESLKNVYKIAGKAEAYCFYNGYHLAVSLAAGNCKAVFCHKENDCQSLTRGRGCRYPLLSRPSIEACKIDRSKLIEVLHWETGENKHDFMGMVFVD